MAQSIWGASAVTPAATDRIPVDVSSSGAPSRWTGQDVANAASRIGVTLNALGSINSNTTIDLANGAYVTATIAGALTFTFSNPPASGQGMQFVLVLTNGGSAVVTWPGSVTWTGGTAPTLRSSGVDVLRFYTSNAGTNWYGELAYGGSANTKWIGAGELIPRVTNGAGIDGEELATNDINLDYLAFDSATSEGAQVSFAWPSGFTTLTATFHWTAASGTGGVRWQASARCYADDDAMDQAQGTSQAVSDTLLAANDAHKSGATSAITPGGTVSAGNLCVVEIERDPSHGDDTLAVDARLIGVLLEFSA